MLRLIAPATRLLAVTVLVAACGAPPDPLPTAPPPAPTVSASVPGTYPPAGAQSYPTYAMPTGTLAIPAYPAPALPTVTAIPTPTRPSPAPKCAHGPTATQVIAVVRNRPGIPTGTALDVKQGPFCAGRWQFTVLGEAGKTLDQVEPLLVVTTGRPSALTVVEAGGDVCSSHVEHAAPAGIRVLACGS